MTGTTIKPESKSKRAITQSKFLWIPPFDDADGDMIPMCHQKGTLYIELLMESSKMIIVGASVQPRKISPDMTDIHAQANS